MIFAPAICVAETAFDRAAVGPRGIIGQPEASCEAKPFTITFSENEQRAHFRWRHKIQGYDDQWTDEANYTVLASDQSTITMALDHENRRQPNGDLFEWVLHILPNANVCWKPTHRPDGPCLAEARQCKIPSPVS